MAKAQTKGSPRRLKSEFASLKEWGDWVNANCAPARADYTPVIGLPPAHQTGPRKRATHEELMALIEEQRARIEPTQRLCHASCAAAHPYLSGLGI
jgi:hypothetical protein